jgi:hypothetical protein
MAAQSDSLGSAGSAGNITEAQIGSSKNDDGLEKLQSIKCLWRVLPAGYHST